MTKNSFIKTYNNVICFAKVEKNNKENVIVFKTVMNIIIERVESKTSENTQICHQIDNKNEMILFITDIHIKFKNLDDINVLENKIKSMDGLMFIVIGGDILDTHERLHTQLLNRAYKFIETCSNKALTIVLVGNHDYINNQQFLTDAHWMNALKKWNNVIIVDTVISILNEFTSLRYLCVPFVPPGRFLDALKLFPAWQNYDIIFAHQEIKGCKMGIIKSIEGDVWEDSYPLLVSGHIHDRQFVGKNVFYPGSTLNHSCNDVGGMFILTCSQRKDNLHHSLESSYDGSRPIEESGICAPSTAPPKALRALSSQVGSPFRQMSETPMLMNSTELFFKYKNISFIYIDLGFVPKKTIYTDIDNIETVIQNTFKVSDEVAKNGGANKTTICISGSKEDIVAFRRSREYTKLSSQTRVKFNCTGASENDQKGESSLTIKPRHEVINPSQRDSLFWSYANKMVEKAADPELKKDFHSVKTQCLHI